MVRPGCCKLPEHPLGLSGLDFEIEVYDHSPERALELVTKGEIQPVE
jgi:hypothetical protein